MTETKNPWITHVRNIQKKHPTLSYKDVLVKAKETYCIKKK